MYSYPNLIPLPVSTVRQIVDAVDPFESGRIYVAWWGKCIPEKAKDAVHHSADRYIRAIQE